MNLRNWLFALGSLILGTVFGRWFTLQLQRPAQTILLQPHKIAGRGKLSLSHLLWLIEENGGPEGLDLSGRDLSWADFSSETIKAVLQSRKISEHDSPPVWVSPHTWGRTLVSLNLRGANLQGANLRRANLHGVDLSHANLQDVDLHDASLRSADLYYTDLKKARLWRADLREAIADNANFWGASLYRVHFGNTRMVGAILTDTQLVGANLSEVRLTRQSIGSHILQEQSKQYLSYLYWDSPKLKQHELDKLFVRRLERAREIWAELFNSFLSHGYYDDASWAHYKERSLYRQMHATRHARLYFGNNLPANMTIVSWRWWWFYLQYLIKWLFLWGSELSCGYGERPFRAFWWALVIILVYPPLYWLSGGVVLTDGNTLTWLDYLNYSLGAFATVNFVRFGTINWQAEALTSIEALLGISTLALLMFALGNRVSRS